MNELDRLNHEVSDLREEQMASSTVVESDLLIQGLNELVRADWLLNAKLSKAIHRRDQARRLAAPLAA